MNSFLKDIMANMEGKTPVSCEEICSMLHDREIFVRSALSNLEELGLVKKIEYGKFELSEKGAEYISMTEIEQRKYEKEHPFILFRDLTGKDGCSDE